MHAERPADRHRDMGWTDPNRIEDDRARLAEGHETRREREWQHGTRPSPATGSAARGRWSTSPHCTDRERTEAWPLG